MSTFYGTVEGNRGEATRCGSEQSGIRASAQSWNGSVIVRLCHRDGELMVSVATSDVSDCYGFTKWYGTFNEFKELLEGAKK